MSVQERSVSWLVSADHCFGAEVRHWRERRRFTLRGLGAVTHDSHSLLARIENGERRASFALACRLDEALETGGVLRRLHQEVVDDRRSRQAQGAPAGERNLFGAGPVTVAVPTRVTPDRGFPMIATEDSVAAERMTSLLTGLGFTVHQYRIPIGGDWARIGDIVVICGPKTSQVTVDALAADPLLLFTEDQYGRWGIRVQATGERFLSGMDDAERSAADVAYVGRLPYRAGHAFIVAGVHAIGSVGAVHHLAGHLDELHDVVGDGCWSGVVRSRYEAETIIESEWACPPQRH